MGLHGFMDCEPLTKLDAHPCVEGPAPQKAQDFAVNAMLGPASLVFRLLS